LINGPVGVYRKTAIDQAASRKILLNQESTISLEKINSDIEIKLLNTSVDNPYPFLDEFTKSTRKRKVK
jgi:hypothetical protein